MRPFSRRTLLAGGLAAATLLFAGVGVSESAQQLTEDDDPSGPRGTETVDGRANETPSGTGTGETPSESDPAGASATLGVLSQGHPVHGVPRLASARATRGAASANLRGVLWITPSPPSGNAGTTTGREPPTVTVTLRAVDLVDTAHDRRIDAATLRLVREGQPPALFPQRFAVNSGVPVRWHARVPLREVHSGTYHGHLLITNEGGVDWAPEGIPVVVRVKDPPWLSLLILLSGLAMVGWMRRYRETARARDEAFVRVGDAEARIVSDPLLRERGGIGEPFRGRFASHLRAAVTALESSAVATGEAALKKAETLWVAWQEGRPDWKAGLEQDWRAIQALSGRPRSTHATALLQEVEKGYQAAPDFAPPPVPGETPAPDADQPAGPEPDPRPDADVDPNADPNAHRNVDADAERRPDQAAEGEGDEETPVEPEPAVRGPRGYREAAGARARRVARYLEFVAEVDAVAVEAVGVPDPEKQRQLVQDLDAIRRGWDEFDPSDDAATDEKRNALRGSLRAAREDAGLAERPSPAGGESAEAGYLDVREDEYDEPEGPELIPRHFAPRIKAARDRRWVYVAVLVATVYAALVLFGFQETWGSDPEFGADWLKDYLQVLAWALGINALTAAGLAAFAGQWALPWLGGTTSAPSPDAAQGSAAAAESAALAGGGRRVPRLQPL